MRTGGADNVFDYKKVKQSLSTPNYDIFLQRFGEGVLRLQQDAVQSDIRTMLVNTGTASKFLAVALLASLVSTR